MDKLLREVLEDRSQELVGHIVERQGFSVGIAEAFVDLAGRELMKSWRWQASALQVEDLPTWSNVQQLLGTVHANALASALDVSPEEVWQALRTFVPRVLLLASRTAHAGRPSRGTPASDFRRPPARLPLRMEAAS